MRILFWNTGKRSVVGLLRNLSRSRDVDILVLAEVAAPIAEVVNQLNEGMEQTYSLAQERLPKPLRRPLHVLTRLREDRVVAIRDTPDIVVKRVFPIIGLDFTIVALHLRSKLHQSHDVDQALAAADINAQIRAVEGTIGHRRTLVVGDFNMDPFEPGLVSFDCFHAVMSRTTAQRRSRKIGRQEHFFFYNPMWNHFGDHPSPPGSYYRTSSGRTEYFWHSFNQVLLRPDLLDCFRDDGLEVLTRIGEISLVKENGIPDLTTGSDHLPLLLELSIERDTEYGRTESVAGTEG